MRRTRLKVVWSTLLRESRELELEPGRDPVGWILDWLPARLTDFLLDRWPDLKQETEYENILQAADDPEFMRDLVQSYTDVGGLPKRLGRFVLKHWDQLSKHLSREIRDQFQTVTDAQIQRSLTKILESMGERALIEMPYVMPDEPVEMPGTGEIVNTLLDMRFERDKRTRDRQSMLRWQMMDKGLVWKTKTDPSVWVFVKGGMAADEQIIRPATPEDIRSSMKLPNGWENIAQVDKTGGPIEPGERDPETGRRIGVHKKRPKKKGLLKRLGKKFFGKSTMESFSTQKKRFLDQGSSKEDIDTAFARFKELKTRGLLKSSEKDIDRYKSFQELSTLLASKAQAVSKTQKRREEKISGATEVYEDDNWKVYSIDTFKASTYYGAGTKWCLSGSGDEGADAFFDFRKDNAIYFVLSKTEPGVKYAVLAGEDGKRKIWDAADKSIPNLPQEVSVPEGTFKFYSFPPLDVKTSSPKELYRYALYIIKGRWPEAEPYIMRDSWWAYGYALDVLEDRWPEAEPYIMKDPARALLYALNVLKRRWPEAESVIKQDSTRWERYKEVFGIEEDINNRRIKKKFFGEAAGTQYYCDSCDSAFSAEGGSEPLCPRCSVVGTRLEGDVMKNIVGAHSYTAGKSAVGGESVKEQTPMFGVDLTEEDEFTWNEVAEVMHRYGVDPNKLLSVLKRGHPEAFAVEEDPLFKAHEIKKALGWAGYTTGDVQAITRNLQSVPEFGMVGVGEAVEDDVKEALAPILRRANRRLVTLGEEDGSFVALLDNGRSIDIREAGETRVLGDFVLGFEGEDFDPLSPGGMEELAQRLESPPVGEGTEWSYQDPVSKFPVGTKVIVTDVMTEKPSWVGVVKGYEEGRVVVIGRGRRTSTAPEWLELATKEKVAALRRSKRPIGKRLDLQHISEKYFPGVSGEVIDDGQCGLWGVLAQDADPSLELYEVFDPLGAPIHVIVGKGRRFYDAENPRGVTSIRKLAFADAMEFDPETAEFVPTTREELFGTWVSERDYDRLKKKVGEDTYTSDVSTTDTIPITKGGKKVVKLPGLTTRRSRKKVKRRYQRMGESMSRNESLISLVLRPDAIGALDGKPVWSALHESGVIEARPFKMGTEEFIEVRIDTRRREWGQANVTALLDEVGSVDLALRQKIQEHGSPVEVAGDIENWLQTAIVDYAQSELNTAGQKTKKLVREMKLRGVTPDAEYLAEALYQNPGVVHEVLMLREPSDDVMRELAKSQNENVAKAAKLHFTEDEGTDPAANLGQMGMPGGNPMMSTMEQDPTAPDQMASAPSASWQPGSMFKLHVLGPQTGKGEWVYREVIGHEGEGEKGLLIYKAPEGQVMRLPHVQVDNAVGFGGAIGPEALGVQTTDELGDEEVIPPMEDVEEEFGSPPTAPTTPESQRLERDPRFSQALAQYQRTKDENDWEKVREMAQKVLGSVGPEVDSALGNYSMKEDTIVKPPIAEGSKQVLGDKLVEEAVDLTLFTEDRKFNSLLTRYDLTKHDKYLARAASLASRLASIPEQKARELVDQLVEMTEEMKTAKK